MRRDATPMRWLVDGYNVLHVMGHMPAAGGRAAPGALEKARKALLDLLAAGLRDRASKAVVVFDAAGGPADLPKHFLHKGVQVYFTRRREEADDLIEAFIHDRAHRELTVVSNDRRLQKAARQRNCQALGCEPFLTWLRDQRRDPLTGKLPDEPPEKEAGLKPGQGDPLLDELADLDHRPQRKDEFPEEWWLEDEG